MHGTPPWIDADWAERALDASGLVLIVGDESGAITGMSAGARSFLDGRGLSGVESLLSIVDGTDADELSRIASGIAEPLRLPLRDGSTAGGIAASHATIAPMGDGQSVVCTINGMSANARALGEVDDLVRAASSEGVWDWDLLTGRVWWSEQLRRMLGQEDAPAVGEFNDRFASLLHPDDEAPVSMALSALLEGTSEEYRVEARMKVTGGSYRWLLVRGCALRDDSGRTVRVAGSSLDIHDRKEAEQALRESEHRLRDLADHLPQVVWSAGPDGVVDEVNERFTELSGAQRDSEQNTNEFWLNVVHPDDRADLLRRWEQSLQTGVYYDHEFRIWHESDKRYHWYLAQARAWRDSTGAIVRWYGTSTEIDERKRAILALQESERRFRTVANAAPVLVWVVDARGRMNFLNRTGREFVGCAPNDDPHDAFMDAIHPDDRSAATARVGECIAKGEHCRREYRLRHAEWGERWVLCTAAPRLNDAGEVLGLVGVSVDITDRKAEEQRTRRLMDELDHRVKNNLGAIMYMAERSLASTNSLDSFRRSFTARLHAMSRTHEALATSRWTGVSLRSVIAMALGPYEDPATGRVSVDGPAVVLGPDQAGPMGLVLHELGSNAARHGSLRGRGGRVEIRWTIRHPGERPEDGRRRASEVHGDNSARELELCWTERIDLEGAGTDSENDAETMTAGPGEDSPDAGAPHSSVPRGDGYGLSLVEGLVRFDLRGWVQLRTDPAGVRHRMGFPLDGAARAPDSA
ncbi:MAG: PAS domain-containing protein [Phycisphaerales bacterium]